MPSKIQTAIVLLFVFVLTSLPCHAKRSAPPPFEGTMAKVFDGDSFLVRHKGKMIGVRLFGVDCPEKDQPFGEKAKAFTSGFVGRKIKVLPKSIDKYGRIIARVRVAGKGSLNLMLLERGLAWWYQRYAFNQKDLARAWWAALKSGKGLWGADSPQVEPEKWRYLMKKKKP